MVGTSLFCKPINFLDRRPRRDSSCNSLSAHENEFNGVSSAKTSDYMMFDWNLDEASNLLKQAKEFIKVRHCEEQAEIMLYMSTNILSKVMDLKPVILLVVGQ